MCPFTSSVVFQTGEGALRLEARLPAQSAREDAGAIGGFGRASTTRDGHAGNALNRADEAAV